MGATSDQLREAIANTDREMRILADEAVAFRQLAYRARQSHALPVPLPGGEHATTYTQPDEPAAQMFDILVVSHQSRIDLVSWRRDQLARELDVAIKNGE